jgi:hypothetical protein
VLAFTERDVEGVLEDEPHRRRFSGPSQRSPISHSLPKYRQVRWTT